MDKVSNLSNLVLVVTDTITNILLIQYFGHKLINYTQEHITNID